MNPDYAIFVFPRPWIWLSTACLVLTLALYGWVLRRQRWVRRRVAELAEPMVDICRRNGFTAEAEQIERDVARLRRTFWSRLRRRKEPKS